jgi:hypothetical protein
VRFSIVNVGGFLGIGGTRVAVPWTAFQITKEGDKPKFVVDGTKDFLEKAPRVDDKKYDFALRRRDRRSGIYLLARDLAPLSLKSGSPVDRPYARLHNESAPSWLGKGKPISTTRVEGTVKQLVSKK